MQNYWARIQERVEALEVSLAFGTALPMAGGHLPNLEAVAENLRSTRKT